MSISSINKITILTLIAILLVACSSPETIVEEGESAPDNATSGRGSGSDIGTPVTGIKTIPTRAIAGNNGGWLDGSPAEIIAIEGEKIIEEVGEVAMASDSVESKAPPAAASSSGKSEDAIAANQQLTAGNVDDNANWDDYLLYLRQYSGARVIKVDVSQRYQIQVTDNAGIPLLAAIINIEASDQRVARLRTHSDGTATFFPQNPADSYMVNVDVAGVVESFEMPAAGSQRQFTFIHTTAQQPAATRLDILFLIDATGSMGNEIAQLKANIQTIAAQIDALPSQPDVRFGMTVYRDQGDDYISRTFDFTPDVTQFATALAEVEANGGGDYPEDLNEGLSRALHAPEWRVEETVSLIFLLADAPPHLDYGQENNYAVEMVKAAERGIKIYPIASSGLDDQGEYIFRQLAQFTGGLFLFLTYGAGGAGTSGSETTHHVNDYAVTSLDGLVIKIVEEELAHRGQ